MFGARAAPWSALLWLAATLAVVVLAPPVAAYYGVAVLYAQPGGPVPNADCIYVYKCAPLPRDFNVTVSQLPSDVDYDAAIPVYVGRAAGRCQRRIQAHKCAIQDAVVQENQCRAATWPDEDTVAAPADLSSVEACIVKQCQGKQIVLQYYTPQVSSSAQLRQLQQYWITHNTSDSSLVPKAVCNQYADTPSAVPSATPVWVEVPLVIWSGPFGTEDQSEPPNRTCSQSACLPPQTLALGLLPGTCNETIPMRFSCVLGLLPGYMVESGDLQLQCQDQQFSSMPVVKPQFPLLDDVSTLFNASALASNGSAILHRRRLLMDGDGASGSSGSSGAPANSSNAPAASPGISVRGYYQHILGSSYQLRSVLPLNNVDAVPNALAQARLEIQLQFHGAYRPLFNPLRYFLWRVILTDGTTIVVAFANHEANTFSSYSLSPINPDRIVGSTMPLDRTPRSWGYLVAIFQVDVQAVTPNDQWPPSDAMTLVYPVQQGNVQLADLNAQPVDYDGTPNGREQFQFAVDQIQGVTIDGLPELQQFNIGPNLQGAARRDALKAAKEAVKIVIRRLAVILAESLRSLFVESFLIIALTPSAPDTYPSLQWADTPIVWNPRGTVRAAGVALQPGDAAATMLWLYQNFWRFATVRVRALIAGEDIVGMDNALLPPMEHRQYERALVQDGLIAIPGEDLLRLTHEAEAFEQQARDEYHRYRNEVPAEEIGDAARRLTLNPDHLQGAYNRLRPGNRADGVASDADRRAVRLNIWQRAVDARVQLHARLAELLPASSSSQQSASSCSASSHSSLCNCFRGDPRFDRDSPSARRLLSLTANVTECVPVYDAPFLIFSIDLGSADAAPILGDANGDGLGDVVAYDGTVCKSAATFLYSGDSFALQRCLPFNLSADVVHGDFDGDHNWDYLVRSSSATSGSPFQSPCPPTQYTLFFTRSDGAVGRFECINSVRSNATVYQFLAMDLDGDGASDLLAQATLNPDTPSANTTALINQHSDTFYAAATSLDDELHLPAAHTRFVPGDFNGDGVEDLFIICSGLPCGRCPTRAMASLSLGNGSFSVPSCFPHLNASIADDVWVTDVDGDGLADVVTSAAVDDCKQVSVFLTRLDPNSTVPRWTPPSCSGPDLTHAHFKLLIGDIDGDGDQDLVFSHDMSCPSDGPVVSSYWLSDPDTGAFASQRCLSASILPDSSPAFSGLLDINGDGTLEVLTHAHGALVTTVMFLADATLV